MEIKLELVCRKAFANKLFCKNTALFYNQTYRILRSQRLLKDES